MENVTPSESEEVSALEERVPLNWHIPVGLASRYAQHMLVQASEVDVTLSFFELKPPIIMADTPLEEQKRILKEGITAECVARVTLARARYNEFLKAFMGVIKPDEKESSNE